MKNIIRFGEDVEGFDIPVLNEREIRAAAGILFLATFTTLMFILFKGNFVPFKYVLISFFADFAIRVFINPAFSPTMILGRLIVRNQTPEYVGAAQKKFAWIIGFVLAAVMVLFLVVINAYSVITGIICLVCLIFLFFESAFGICLGCMLYPIFFKDKVQYCPGEVCDIKQRQDIQKTSVTQILVMLVFAVFIFAAGYVMKDMISETPHDLFGNQSTDQPRS